MKKAGIALALAVTFAAARGEAFCGFYVSGADAKLFNDATQVVLMREGTRTVLSMQNDYQGPPSDFAMVVPVPVVLQKENVKTLPKELFKHIDQLDAPRLVEYWEQDPCAVEADVDRKGGQGFGNGMGRLGGAHAAKAEDLGVKIEAQFTVGEYEIVILSAKSSSGLDTWLKQENYKIPDGSEPYLRPYVQSGSKFFVARVDAKKVTFDDKGHAALSPLRFHYDTESFNLPVRLGLVNSKGTQDLIVHIVAKGQRYELANYPNVTIPTNFDVAENARTSFGSSYASLFDRTLEKNQKAIVTEYSWDAGTCDPCPGPVLSPNDIATLGADVMPETTAAPPAQGRRFNRSVFSGYVLTRLHARYSKESLGEDLVFKAAPPIMGGREVRGTNGDLEHGATPAGTNNFQGRYAIRHAWGGPVACKEPHRGIWGGPPMGYGGGATTSPKPALDLAFAVRDAPLASFVRGDITELAVKGEGVPPAPAMPALPDAGNFPTAETSTNADAGPPPKADEPSVKKGCMGCATVPVSSGTPALALASAILALFLFRRRADS